MILLICFSGTDKWLLRALHLMVAEIISDLATMVTLTANCLFSFRFLSLTLDCLLIHQAILLRIWIATEAVVTMDSESESLSAHFQAFLEEAEDAKHFRFLWLVFSTGRCFCFTSEAKLQI